MASFKEIAKHAHEVSAMLPVAQIDPKVFLRMRSDLRSLRDAIVADSGSLLQAISAGVSLGDQGQLREAAMGAWVLSDRDSLRPEDAVPLSQHLATISSMLQRAADDPSLRSNVVGTARPTEPSYIGHQHGPWFPRAELGEGGQGVVRRAWNESLCTAGALKVFKPRRNAAQAEARFMREREALLKLDHPCIVRLLDYGEQPEPFMVTQLAPLRSLADHAPAFAGDLWRTMRMARDVAIGLGTAHEAGLVHRDVKPGNIFLVSLDHAAVGDFGIVHDPSLEALTKTDEKVGSHFFAPPEYADYGAEPAPSFDVFGLGGVLHIVMQGKDRPKRAYSAERGYANLTTMLGDNRLEPVDVLLAEMLAEDAANRPQSMRDVVSAIDRILRDLMSGISRRDRCARCGEGVPQAAGVLRAHGRHVTVGNGRTPVPLLCPACGYLQLELPPSPD